MIPARARVARARPRPWHFTTAQPTRPKADIVDPPQAMATADTVMLRHLLPQRPSAHFELFITFLSARSARVEPCTLKVAVRGLELQAQQNMQFLVEGPEFMPEGGRLQLRSRSTGAAPDLNYPGLSTMWLSGCSLAALQ